MKTITVMFRNDDVDPDKVIDLIDRIGQVASEMGVVIDATFEDTGPQTAEDVLLEFIDAGDDDEDWLDEDLEDDDAGVILGDLT